MPARIPSSCVILKCFYKHIASRSFHLGRCIFYQKILDGTLEFKREMMNILKRIKQPLHKILKWSPFVLIINNASFDLIQETGEEFNFYLLPYHYYTLYKKYANHFQLKNNHLFERRKLFKKHNK